VTGAGRGLGRSYAMLLAGRGTKVVVNDLGVAPDGTGRSAEPARETTRAIIDLGGEAIASVADVGDPDQAAAIMASAVDEFGRVDILINNAGAGRSKDFADFEPADLRDMLKVHVEGPFYLSQAAWPVMRAQRHGRIVTTSSVAALGLAGKAAYGTGKAGVLGLTRALAIEGHESGITANCVFPAASTRLLKGQGHSAAIAAAYAQAPLLPERVAALVAWLSHEQCTTTGEFFHARAGYVGRIMLAQSTGFSDLDLSPEDVRDHWADIMAEDLPTATVLGDTDAAIAAAFTRVPGRITADSK
jgi:NAD(P)-dependent dehydrogenase (short-subunit alcohol dehydrogenase family)